MEIWNLYTANRELTEETLIRGEEIPDDLYHLVVHVWIKNSDGKYLISQRSANRTMHPLMWECPGGSVMKDETSLEGAIREVKEEVGVDLNEDDGKLLFSRVRKKIKGKIYNDILDVWLFQYDGIVNLFEATTDEVEDVIWMTREEIEELFKENKFVESLKYFFDEVDGK